MNRQQAERNYKAAVANQRAAENISEQAYLADGRLGDGTESPERAIEL